MQQKIPLLAGIVLFLIGCGAYDLPPLSPNHPASAEAVVAPRAQRSQTLAYTRADVPSRTPVRDTGLAQQGGHEMHHPGDSPPKTVSGEGRVVAVVLDTGQVVVDHGEISGFMGAMTMGYPVQPPSQLKELKPGDQVRFTIDVGKKAIVKIEKLN